MSKVDALRGLVAGAIAEQEQSGGLFEGNFDTPYLDQLVTALRTSDALEVLASELGV